MPKKTKTKEWNPIIWEEPKPPHHHLVLSKDDGLFRCARCGYVLGSAGGKMPKCPEATTISDNEKSLDRLVIKE